MIYILGIIVLLIFGGLNFYVGDKIYLTAGFIIPNLNGYVYWVIFFLIAFSYLLGKFLKNHINLSVEKKLDLVGSYWVGAFSYLLIIYLVLDIINFLCREIGWDVVPSYSNIIILVGVIVILIYGRYHALQPKVVNYDIRINKPVVSEKSLKIVMVSDIHLGNIVDKKRLAILVDRINELNPELVLLAGDIIDDDITPFIQGNMGQELLRLKPSLGVYGILGNHEYFNKDSEKLQRAYKEAGIIILRDQAVNIQNEFCILGREDLSYKGRKSLDEILVGVNKNLPLILMDHQPYKLGEAEENGIDIQFSGHTHGGQFYPGNLIVRAMFQQYWGGLKKGNTNYIISSGYGTWGPPIRIGTDSEIIVVNLTFSTH